MILPDFIAERIPGTRTVVKGEFIDQGKVVATIRAGTRVSLGQQIGEADAALFTPPTAGGFVLFTRELRLRLPWLGDQILNSRELGKTPEGYPAALDALPR